MNIERHNVEIADGYLSNLAIARLRRSKVFASKNQGKRALKNAMVLRIDKLDFIKRYDLMNPNLVIEGDIYAENKELLALVFPVDLVNQNHVIIHKWRII